MFRLLGSCNGFVLVSLGTSIFLWNPATKDSEKVLTHEVLACRGKGANSIMYGLCYDSSTEDYKVIIGLRSIEFSASEWVNVVGKRLVSLTFFLALMRARGERKSALAC